MNVGLDSGYPGRKRRVGGASEPCGEHNASPYITSWGTLVPKHTADPSPFVIPATRRVRSQKADLENLGRLGSDAVKLSAQIPFVFSR